MNLIPDAVRGLNDSGQLIASWGQTLPTVYDGYGVWAGETRAPIPNPPGFGYQSDSYTVINNSGQVASEAVTWVQSGQPGQLNSVTYIWHATETIGQTAIDLGALGGQNSAAAGINDAGQVVGNADTSAGTSHAFIATNGKMTDLGTLPGGQYSSALGINNAGQVIGYAEVNSTSTPVSGPHEIFPGYPIFGGGYHAVLYQQGQVTDLGTLGGANSVAMAINQSGQIVGTAETATGAQHAFLYQNGKMQDLGVLNSNWSQAFWGVAYSQAYGINNAGAIVGESNSLAFLDENGKMYNLNNLVNIPNITLSQAWAINNVGQILATGYVTGSATPFDNQEMFLLNPVDLPDPVYAVPEPSTLAIIGVMTLWLAARRISRPPLRP